MSEPGLDFDFKYRLVKFYSCRLMLSHWLCRQTDGQTDTRSCSCWTTDHLSFANNNTFSFTANHVYKTDSSNQATWLDASNVIITCVTHLTLYDYMLQINLIDWKHRLWSQTDCGGSWCALLSQLTRQKQCKSATESAAFSTCGTRTFMGLMNTWIHYLYLYCPFTAQSSLRDNANTH